MGEVAVGEALVLRRRRARSQRAETTGGESAEGETGQRGCKQSRHGVLAFRDRKSEVQPNDFAPLRPDHPARRWCAVAAMARRRIIAAIARGDDALT
jgi:hypothetical protein